MAIGKATASVLGLATVLAFSGAAGVSAFSYDEAHRRLAATLGWAAMPSPADTVTRTPAGYRAEVHNWELRGHRSRTPV